MRFGLQIDTYGDNEVGNDNHFDTMLAVARAGEAAGFESVWYEDHFMWRDDARPETPSPRLECLLTLAALAAATERVRLGALVLGAPYRNPALLAKMSATLDQISHGRSIIGLGAAWHRQEFDAYGWPFGTVKERLERLEDAVRIVDAMLTERPASYTGKHHAIDRALNDPPPVQRPRPPILIGGNGEQLMLPLVGRQADMWNTGAGRGLESFSRKRDIIRRSAEAAGRDPSSIVLTVTREAPLPQTSDESAQWVEELQKWTAEGVGHILLDFGHVTSTEPVQRFVEEVMKPLR